MALLKLFVVALCVASVSATSRIHKLSGALQAQAHGKSVLDRSAAKLGAGVSRAQLQSEYQHVLRLMDELQITEQSTAQYTAAQCTALISKVNRDASSIKASVEAFEKASGSKSDGNKNWWMHSGTASYLYGIRNALTDVDMHWHGMAGNVGHIEYHANQVGNPVEVDSYDPCVDKTKPFFQTLETGILLMAKGGTPITAEVKSTGYRVITLAQLKYEYENLVKDTVRQAKPAKAKSDAETLAGIDKAAKENGIGLGKDGHGDPLTF